VVEYREFAGRTHRIISQDGWEEVAEYALAWALGHAVAAPIARADAAATV
jgi:non-heme chloroperoxidase